MTREILESLEYEDPEVLSLLEEGSTLAGEIDAAKVFQSSYKPCLTTLDQLSENAVKRNMLTIGIDKEHWRERPR